MNRKWWKEGVVYQIWPRSFYDSNEDGIGDIRGIIQKLDYIKNLGVDIIWLSPVYKSPNFDNGYDISNYREIMEEAGTMDDMDELIEKIHNYGLKLIMDLVVNHTSSEHPWFIESRSSKDNFCRDYYIWKKGKNNKEPNNWKSVFGGSAWEYDEKSEEYYLHLFSKKQPDLNWENPEVRREIYDLIKWWLDKGIDGFRLDAINMISKDPNFPDGEIKEGEKYGSGRKYYYDRKEVHTYLKEMNEKVLSKYDIMTVGEAPRISSIEEAKKYIDPANNELDMIFLFDLNYIDNPNSKWKYEKWKLNDLKKIFKNWYDELIDNGWIALFMNNHDQPRMVSRYGDDGKYRIESAKMLATLIYTLPGTPYIYQGEEIGMTNVNFYDIENYRDIETINWYNQKKEENVSDDEIIDSIHRFSRDNARTPMQWSDETNAGFTKGKPWIECNPNYKEINVEDSLNNPDSIYNYYKKLINLRKKNLVFIYGDFQTILENKEEIYIYLRKYYNDYLLVLLNFYGNNVNLNLFEELRYKNSKLLISNYPEQESKNIYDFNLRPYEARIYKLFF